MHKTFLKWILIGALALGLMGAAVSCKDYSSDIDNLQSQITALSGNVDYLQSLINQGKVVTGVESTGDGIRISFSDGSSYEITNGKDGVNGANGADGHTPVITIGSNGNWYIDGTDTGVQAKGEKGDTGAQGEKGDQGEQGIQGEQGEKGDTGADGHSPEITIGENGNWYIDGDDTGISATGSKGDKGDDGVSYVWTIGEDGLWYLNGILYTGENGEYPEGLCAVPQDGHTPVITIGEDGNWYVDGEDLGVPATGANGQDGQTPQIGENGNWWIGNDDTGVPATGAAGQNGQDGKSYLLKPNYESGYWELYEVTYNSASTSEDETEDEGSTGTDYTYELIDAEFMPLADADYALTAVWDGNYLYIYNVKTPIYDESGNITGYTFTDYPLYLGARLSSIAFVPKYIDKDIFYPTTDKDYVSFGTYYDEDKFDETTYELTAQTDWSISSQVVLTYRLNPTNAYIESATAPQFLNRSVETRAANEEGDDFSLLNVVGAPKHEGEYYKVTTTLNSSALKTGENVHNLVALRLYTGTDEDQILTSDYIVVKSTSDVSAFIVDSQKTTEGQAEEEATKFYTRNQTLSANNGHEGETSDFIKQFVTKTGDTYTANASFGYLESFDLSTIVDLYTNQNKYFTDLGLSDNVTFQYTIPAEFLLGTEGNEVNQQQYIDFYTAQDNSGNEGNAEVAEAVTSDNSVVCAKGGTTAIGKTPVVRVDAYVDGHLVASAYILLQIAKGDPLAALSIEVGDPLHVKYREINGDKTSPDTKQYLSVLTNDEMVENVFSQIDGIETTEDFWTAYTDYSVSCYYAIAETEDPGSYTAFAGDETDVNYNAWCSAHGIDWYISKPAASNEEDTPGAGEVNPEGGEQGGETTPEGEQGGSEGQEGSPTESDGEETVTDDAFIKISVDNLLLTQHSIETTIPTAHKFGTEEVKFMLKITFNSPNTDFYPDVVLTQVIYDVDECPEYKLNELYKVPDPSKYGLDSDANAVLCKGQLNANGEKYEMTTKVSEHFDGGSDIFTSGIGAGNVKNITFDWAENTEGVTPEAGAGTITKENPSVGLSDAISQKNISKEMQYIQELENGESCTHSYYIIFVNPFESAEAETVYVTDIAGENKADVNKGVKVTDDSKPAKDILTYVYAAETTPETGSLKLSDYATSQFKLSDTEESTDIKISYELDKENGDWTYFSTQIQKLNGAAQESEGTAKLEFGIDDDGMITWQNGGTKLQYSYTFYVNITVTLGKIGSVDCKAKVILNDGYDPYVPSNDTVSPSSIIL